MADKLKGAKNHTDKPVTQTNRRIEFAGLQKAKKSQQSCYRAKDDPKSGYQTEQKTQVGTDRRWIPDREEGERNLGFTKFPLFRCWVRRHPACYSPPSEHL